MKEFAILRSPKDDETRTGGGAATAGGKGPKDAPKDEGPKDAPKDGPDDDSNDSDETYQKRQQRIIKSLLKDNARIIKANVIGVGVGEENASGSRSLSFSLDKRLQNVDGVLISVLWDTTFGVFSQLKHDVTYSMYMPIIQQHPLLLQFLLAGASVEFIVKDVVGGEPFCNPFSEKQTMSVAKENKTLSWLTKVTLSQPAMQLLQNILFGNVDVARLEATIAPAV